MKFPSISLKGFVVISLLAGSAAGLIMLGSGNIPGDNRDFFSAAWGAWTAWTAMAVKRVLDGSESSDAKNDTIAALSGAVVTAQAQPAAEPTPTP